MSKSFVHRVPGVVGTRKSPRTYTHATVITITDESSKRAALTNHEWFLHHAKSNWDYYVRSNNPKVRVWGDFDGYVAANLAATLAGRTPAGKYVLSWHQTESAGRKFAATTASKGRYAEVELLEVERSAE